MRTLLLLFCALAVGLLPAQAQTTADSAPAFARFGATVAADGGTMYVAEANISGKSGIVFAYEKDPSGAWLEIGQIMPAEGEPGERFGTSISADGDVIAIGAPRHNERAGAVYLFTRGEDGLFAQTAMLAADGLAGGDGFGAAVALDGDWLLVGAPGTMERKGAAYAFNRGEDGTWMQAGMMADESGKAKDELGGTLALENGVALVGAPGTKFGGGAVHTYTYTDGAWASAGMLPAEGVKAGNGFGKSVALAGGMAYVGAPMYNRFQGAVLTFSHDGTAWMAGDEISAAEPSRMARFGGALAVDGSRLWVGSTGANGGDGAAYLFEHDGTAWAQTAELMPENPPNNGSFSIDLAASGDAVVIGMAGDDYGAGSAWIYEVGDVTWAPATRVVGEDTSFDPVTGGKLSCEDGPAAGFDCKGMDLVAFLPTKDIGGERGVNLNDIWGWTDPETGKEYALVGRVDGTSFVDITNPEMPVYVGDLPLTEGARPNTWRDIKVFADHAFVVADNAGEHGMQVFDLTQLRGIEEPQTFTETAIYRGINSAHNIVINEETGFAYAVGSSGGGETCGGGLHMIDINEPTNPTFAGCFSDSNTGRSGTGYSHDAQCVVYTGPDADYSGREICIGSNETAISVADVTDKENPVAVSVGVYPNVGYTHQGWLTDDHRFFYVNDELDEIGGNVENTRTLIWDLTDLDDPQLVKEFFLETTSSDHNLYVQDNFMYQSNYDSGLRIFDISDTANPVEVAFIDTTPGGENGPGFSGSWSNYPYFKSGVIAVSSIGEGLFLVKKRDVGT